MRSRRAAPERWPGGRVASWWKTSTTIPRADLHPTLSPSSPTETTDHSRRPGTTLPTSSAARNVRHAPTREHTHASRERRMSSLRSPRRGDPSGDRAERERRREHDRGEEPERRGRAEIDQREDGERQEIPGEDGEEPDRHHRAAHRSRRLRVAE